MSVIIIVFAKKLIPNNSYMAGFLDVSDARLQIRAANMTKYDSDLTGKYRCMQKYKRQAKGKTLGSKNECMEGHKISMKVRLRVKLTSEVKSVTLEQAVNAEVERNAENHIRNLRFSRDFIAVNRRLRQSVKFPIPPCISGYFFSCLSPLP